MGDKRKHMRSQDEIEYINRRRSTRIIALEGKKQQEKERNIALALERKRNLINQDSRNKGKGKAILNVWDDLNGFNNDEGGLTKSGCKNKELYHMISSIKELQRHSWTASTQGTTEACLNGMPLKKILTIIIDFLQRKDIYELFAQPISSDVVENYHKIVKQPMDFGTMRAKLHEDMYTDLELFKRDIFLMCSNAMSFNPKTSQYHALAEDISNCAKLIFKALSVEPELNLEVSLNKRSSSKKQPNGQQRTPRKVAPKHSGGENATNMEKRNMYWPPSKPLVAGILSDKRNIQVNENPNKYKESLMRFVKGLGPVAQRVAAKKLEAFTDQQLCINETPTQNFVGNVSGTQTIHHATQQTPTQASALTARTLPRTLPFLNKPLTFHGYAGQQNRIVNTTNASNVNMRNGPYQGKNWHACAAALLSSIFFNNDNGGSSSGVQSFNAAENMNFKGKMVAQVENNSQFQVGVNNTSNSTRQWNTYAGMPNMLATGSSSSTFAIVHPTVVISGPQPRQKYSMYDMPSNYLTGMHQQVPYIPSPPQSLPDMQMQANHMKPHQDGPSVPLQEPNSSSSLDMALDSGINNFGEGGSLLGLIEEVPAPPPLDTDQQPNLDLGL